MKIHACLLSTVAIVCGVTSAHASDHYQLFRLDVAGEGVHRPDGGGWGGGAAIEPMFNVHDHVSVGARLEGFAAGGGSADGSKTSIGMQVGAATLAKSEFYLTTSSIRPFVGGALGFYHLGGQSIGAGAGTASISQEAGSYFGMAPSLGVELGMFRIGASYNILFGGSQASQSLSAGPSGASIAQSTAGDSISRNYLTLEIGFRFGGGRKVETPVQTAKRDE